MWKVLWKHEAGSTRAPTSYESPEDVKERYPDAAKAYKEHCEITKDVFKEGEDFLMGEPTSMELEALAVSIDGSVEAVQRVISDTQAASLQRQETAASTSQPHGALSLEANHVKSCGLRVGTRFANHTAGAIHGLCPCGFMLPAREMPDSESTRLILYSLMRWFQGQAYVKRHLGCDKYFVVFDDMCHLSRYAQRHKDKHPEIARFVSEPVHVVDKFHFTKNHTGAWCKANVNPYRHKELVENTTNMSVAEQRFKHVGRYSGMFRHFNRSRFNFVILWIADCDHEFRALALL
jgi:hypothetical protein